MSVEALRHMVERVNARDLDGYMDGYAEDVVLHGYPPGVEDRESARAFYGQFLAAFPDIDLSLHQTLAEGDLVATRYVIRGTHSAEFFGVPATGRRVEVEGQSIFRFRDGKIAERWQSLDALGLLTQLGAVPAPA